MHILTIKRGVPKNRNKGRLLKDYASFFVGVAFQGKSTGKTFVVVKEIIYKRHRLETIKNHRASTFDS